MNADAASIRASFVAVVQFGQQADDRGVVFRIGPRHLEVFWTDGHSDVVYRDARGWLWDVYGDTPFTPAGRRRSMTGTRLPIVSRAWRDALAVLPPEVPHG